MRVILLTMFLLIFVFTKPTSADLIMGIYYNPGLKLGVQFGGKTNFVIGFENSITGAMYYGTPFVGVVGGVALNVNERRFITYWEIEGGHALVGFASGGEWNNGYHHSVRVFVGMLAFISYKHLLNTNIHEISLIGKYPLPFYMVMDHGTYVFGKETHHYD